MHRSMVLPTPSHGWAKWFRFLTPTSFMTRACWMKPIPTILACTLASWWIMRGAQLHWTKCECILMIGAILTDFQYWLLHSNLGQEEVDCNQATSCCRWSYHVWKGENEGIARRICLVRTTICSEIEEQSRIASSWGCELYQSNHDRLPLLVMGRYDSPQWRCCLGCRKPPEAAYRHV